MAHTFCLLYLNQFKFDVLQFMAVYKLNHILQLQTSSQYLSFDLDFIYWSQLEEFFLDLN